MRKLRWSKKNDHLKKLKFSKVAPTAFTERGLYMLATILKGERAEKTTLAIVDTFVQVRELARTMEELQNVKEGGVQQRKLLQRTGELLAEVVGHNLFSNFSNSDVDYLNNNGVDLRGFFPQSVISWEIFFSDGS